jgi:hypothetical protein
MGKATASDWKKLLLSMLGYAVAALALALMLNIPGDCRPEVTNCGEGRRQASFVVLVLGIAWLVYLFVRFRRDPKNF